MSTHDHSRSRMHPRLVALAVGAAAAAVFWRTAYPTITWWDSSNYSLAAGTLGVTSPPGSLILTLIGWPVAHLPLGISPAHALNLLAGVLAALTSAFVFLVAMRFLHGPGRASGTPGHGEAHVPGDAPVLAAAAGALAFAFGTTLWEHATKFTPYVLTALFTALILWTMVRWWQDADNPAAWRWLVLLAFLFGLDFSVHRTNALLMPGALAWVLVRDAGAMLRLRTWAAGAGGLAAGLAFHLLVIPIARGTTSPFNALDPATLPAFWDYVSLAQSGGGFLIDLWPRNAGFWGVQVADFLRTMQANFLHVGGALGPLAAVPALAGALGLAALWRRNRRFALAFLLVLFSQAALTVIYFNIPEAYFRSLDRHYLPVGVTFAVVASYGLAVAVASIPAVAAGHIRAVAAVAAGVLLVPAAQLAANWTAQDASRRYFARDYAANALGALPENAIYFTVGDNDTFPVLYLQAVEGVRRDVRIVNLSMANAAWYPEQLRRADPAFPLSLTPDERRAITEQPLADTTITVPIAAAEPPDSVVLRAVPLYGLRMLPADVVLMDLVVTNAWRRPLTFAASGGSGGRGWLADYSTLEGLHWRAGPERVSAGDPLLLRANVFERYEFRGYADTTVRMDDVSRVMAYQYIQGFLALIEAERERGSAARCTEATERLLAVLPPERIGIPGYERDGVEAQCRSPL